MSEQKIGIITECVCDLPKNIISEYNIEIVYFVIKTDTGVFTDTDEITAKNILSYLQDNKKRALSHAPSVEVYKNKFTEMLKTYDEIIHITISSKTSESYTNATSAANDLGELGKKIHIFDSWNLTTGQGFLAIRAAQMAQQGETSEKILSEISELRNKVSTSFVVGNIEHLYRNGRASKRIKDICDTFNLHPVLAMTDGELKPKKIMFGNYEQVSMRYVRKELKKIKKLDRLFLVYAGCSVKKLTQIKKEIEKRCHVDELITTEASATVSSNCGPGAFGLIFIKN